MGIMLNPQGSRDGGPAPANPAADINGDGTVGVDDLLIMLANFG